jgi:hypothetical protein
MITKISVAIGLLFAYATSASASGTLSHCAAASAPERGVLAQAWRDFRSALELSKPTEAQRLVALRLDLSKLVVNKKTLVATVNDVVTQASVPSWLEAGVNQIPSLQEEIERLMSSIEEEARTGGLLGSSSSLSKLMEVLGQKRQVTLCELATIPVPLPKAKLAQVTSLLGEIREEIKSLDELDRTLAKLIENANKAH